jgi:hypothetical protein
MDVHKILAELYEERQRLDEGIAALDRIADGRGWRPRGRPPKWLTEAQKNVAKDPKSRPDSDKPNSRSFKRNQNKDSAAPQ